MGLFRQRKQRNAFLHIGTAGLQMPGHVALTAINLIAPLCRDPAIELVRDCTVQLVNIDRFQAVLQPIDFGAKTGGRRRRAGQQDGAANLGNDDEGGKLPLGVIRCHQPTASGERSGPRP